MASSGARHVESRMTEVPSDVCGVNAPSAAASFFARAAQRLNLSNGGSQRKRRRVAFRTNFRDVLKNHPPPVPPALLRSLNARKPEGAGKVKVSVRLVGGADGGHVQVDARKKQVTLVDPGGGDRLPPKMFAFDAVFTPDDDQAEVCSSSLCDVIASVVGGTDGCLFSYGHAKLGKTRTMVGEAEEPGAVPCAIWWLFRALGEHKHRTGARCSVRVSALELAPHAEQPRDLLKELATGSECSGGPGAFLRDEQPSQSELRAPSAERAAFLLDAAMAARTHESEEDARHAHFLFTLHVYQYRVEKGGRGGVAGGRSRLHLLDLGSGDKSLTALGNVVLALCSGQKHVPYRESGVTQLLRRAVGGVTCRVTMVAHVSTAPSRHPEALSTLQLASRLHRLRRKKLSKFESGGPVGDDKGVCRPFVRLQAVTDETATTDYTSSSEQSCDTVIFVGPPPPPTKSALATEPSKSKRKKQLPSLDSSSSPKMSPKMSKYMDMDPPTTKGTPKGTPTKLRHSESTPKVRHVEPTVVAKAEGVNKGSPKASRHSEDPNNKGSPKVVAKAEGVNKGSPKLSSKQQHEEAKGSPGKVGGKPLSDEAWIDGPRFAKPRFDARALQRERWVDGPALYMDDRKETMVRRWVEDLRTEVWIDFPKKAPPPEKKEGGCQTEDVIPTAATGVEDPSSSSSSSGGGEGAEARMTDSSVQVTEEDIDSSLGGDTEEDEGSLLSPSLHALSADALHRLLDLEEALSDLGVRSSDAHSIRSAPVDPLDYCPPPTVGMLQPLKLEAFYNRIQKVPLFPLCPPVKPTQAVPPTPKLSSSGRGSDLSLLSTETKALLAKTAQFSGTSSGYESLPRETALGDKAPRGRKVNRKKAQQGSSKRSRSVPARPPAPSSSPPQLPPRPRRLMLPPVDPSLWKSEEDVCCTSLLCCRLLDFY